jgi:hypothetical protein
VSAAAQTSPSLLPSRGSSRASRGSAEESAARDGEGGQESLTKETKVEAMLKKKLLNDAFKTIKSQQEIAGNEIEQDKNMPDINADRLDIVPEVKVKEEDVV